MMAAEIGQKWGVGKRSEDNGILILIYPADRDIFIATGYGVEEYIPDGVNKRIIETEIVPSFKTENYYEGLDKATDVMMNLLAGVFTVEKYDKGNEEGAAAFVLLLFIFFTFILFSSMKKKKSNTLGKSLPFWIAMSMLSGGRSGHSGSFGSFKGGSGSFGGFSGGMGGRFGGGGAGGRW